MVDGMLCVVMNARPCARNETHAQRDACATHGPAHHMNACYTAKEHSPQRDRFLEHTCHPQCRDNKVEQVIGAQQVKGGP